MYRELSKREKKIARACIDKGLDTAFREGLEKSSAVISDWRQGNSFPIRKPITNYTRNLQIKMMQSAAGLTTWEDQNTR
jgi:hypothetical protein